MKRSFDEIMNSLKTTISDYRFYTDFDKVEKRIEDYRSQLMELNSLIGSTQIQIDFQKLVESNPDVLKVIPILLAKRDMFINILDVNEKVFHFDYLNLTIDEYVKFMEETGIFYVLQSKKITSLIDYVIGIEVGLDSNARKNRSGTQFANLVEKYILESKYKTKYMKEVSTKTIKSKFGIDLNFNFKDSRTEKVFDFVIESANYLYLVEVNFYSGGGSKLNETARSYRMLNSELSNVKKVKFVWITDGIGWRTVRGGIRDAYNEIEHLYTIEDLENGLFDKF